MSVLFDRKLLETAQAKKTIFSESLGTMAPLTPFEWWARYEQTSLKYLEKSSLQAQVRRIYKLCCLITTQNWIYLEIHIKVKISQNVSDSIKILRIA